MQPRVVLCGTYHRDAEGLVRAYRELEAAGCRILSPVSLDFMDRTQPVVRTHTELDMSIEDLEFYHLRTIRDADFVWLHVPDGLVGLSTAFEMGYALAWRKPVFSPCPVRDEMLACHVTVTPYVKNALQLLQIAT